MLLQWCPSRLNTVIAFEDTPRSIQWETAATLLLADGKSAGMAVSTVFHRGRLANFVPLLHPF